MEKHVLFETYIIVLRKKDSLCIVQLFCIYSSSLMYRPQIFKKMHSICNTEGNRENNLENTTIYVLYNCSQYISRV